MAQIASVFALCVLTAASWADISYTAQERFVSVTLTDGTQRIDAPDFSRFDVSISPSDANSNGQAMQDSTLGATGISARGFAYASSHNLLGFVRAESRLYTEFDIAQTSSFILDGRFATTSFEGGGPSFAHLRFSGPDGDIVNLTLSWEQTIDFRGANAIVGNLAPGHYTLDVDMTPGAAAGNTSRSANVAFALTIPAPTTSIMLFSSLPLLTLRRRRSGDPLMRLFPFPTNPYDDPDTSPTYPDMGPRARSRTAWATTFLTPFDLRMAGDDPDLQDTILPETLMIRDLSCGVQWVFGTPPILNEDREVVRSSRRYVRW